MCVRARARALVHIIRNKNSKHNAFIFVVFLQFNFVGRILGPRGMTAKQLEQETGCKIMVRGKGSMRDKKKVRLLPCGCEAVGADKNVIFHVAEQEDANRGKPNWEHLSDELHVLITVEDTENRAQKKLERAVEEVQKLLIPVCCRLFMCPTMTKSALGINSSPCCSKRTARMNSRSVSSWSWLSSMARTAIPP